MPGIVGLITQMPRERAKRELLQMVDTLRHEDFYVTGSFIEESLGVYVGWVARKGSFCTEMPLRNEGRDVVLVFSGEDFPEPGTIDRLKKAGHCLDAVESSYLVHLAEDDPKFPTGLNGRFHGLVIDGRRATATLFNDRYGMHRLYYHKSQDGFYFAAEAKAILAVRPELRRADPRGLGDFLACGAVLENRTLFRDINFLPPASKWIFRNGSLDYEAIYFQQEEWEGQETLDGESFYTELREVFSRNLPRFFNGHQQVAMSLTGGLDTRMIMAWQRPPAGSLPCYTFGGSYRDCRDVTLARRVARLCEQSHHVIEAGDTFLSRFAHYAERTVYLTDGCVDVGRAPDLFLNEKAREIAPVRMTGNYGGEILRRVRAFKPVKPLHGLFDPEFVKNFQETEQSYARLLLQHPVSFAVFKQGPWYHCGTLGLEQTQLSLRSPYLDNDFVRTVFRAPKEALANNDVSLRLIAEGNTDLLQIPTDRDVTEDRSGLWATAARSFWEFQFKAEYAYDVGMPQWVAQVDHSLSALRLERLFLGRHKAFHFRLWYRDVLASYVREMLLDPLSLSRPYVIRKTVETIVQGHLRGNRNYTTEIHKLLSLELFHRLFLSAN
jgi:asparagine synthase (glutamine-hydrolysing)